MIRKQQFDVVIIGGLGHVGLPLGLVLADTGLKVCLCDRDKDKAVMVKKGRMPFTEYGAANVLKKVLEKGNLQITDDDSYAGKGEYLIIAVGTPVDEHMNPRVEPLLELIAGLKKHIKREQTIIIRSTVYPNTCERINDILKSRKTEHWHISYCPERIAQGYAMKELKIFPQIVSGVTPRAVNSAGKLFRRISPKIIRASVRSAELMKLFANAWRYIQFAAANQFYMISESFGEDFREIRRAMTDNYGRAAMLPGAGFAAGPCLLKDTMQLSASYNNNFLLGHTAMMINEGLPNFLAENLKKRYELREKTVGILGMSFKADIDDIRDSLSYKLRKILVFNGAEVLCSDEYVKDPDFIAAEQLVKLSDILIIGVPHAEYRRLIIPRKKEVIDLWGITEGKAKATKGKK